MKIKTLTHYNPVLLIYTVKCIAIVISEDNKTVTDNKTDNKTVTVNLLLWLVAYVTLNRFTVTESLDMIIQDVINY